MDRQWIFPKPVRFEFKQTIFGKNQMSLNCQEINAILSELNLDGYFIQDIIQPGYDTLSLYLYTNGNPITLLICTAQNSCRLHKTSRKINKNDKPLRFQEFLKSKIKGAKIQKCFQIGLQRIVQMNLSHGDESFILYIRLWSNAANVILCDSQNNILDSMFRRPTKNEVTGGKFIIPDENSSKNNERIWEVRDFSEIEKEMAEKLFEGNANKQKNDEGGNSTAFTFNEKVDFWYGEHAASLSINALLEQTEKWYNQSKSQMLLALEKLEAKQKDFQNAQNYRHQGDLILSFSHLLDGKTNFIECEDYESGKTVHLPIDPKLSAHENAAKYYQQYKKALSGTEALKHDIEIAKVQIENLENQYKKIITEKNPVRMEQLLRKDSKPKQQIKKNHPGLSYIIGDWYIIVGRDANENDQLLRHHVRGADLWLHVRDFPGGYVFIKNRPGKTVPLEILLDAANLAVYYSKARNAGKTDLYYTHVKYLRRAKNGPKGLVLPTHEKNLCITPDKKRLERLDTIHQTQNI